MVEERSRRVAPRYPRYHRRVLLLGALLALAIYVIGAPLFNNRIEDDLEARVPAELSDAGFVGISATFDGQNGTLRCADPLADPEAAIEAAYDVWGVHRIDLEQGCRVRTAPTVGTTVPSEDAADESEVADTEADASTTAVATTEPMTNADFDSVAAIVDSSPELSLLATLVHQTGLAQRLGTDADVTLFAPSDAAFDALPADLLADLRDDDELLTSVLRHHAVAGSHLSADLDTGTLDALDGEPLEIDADGDIVVVSGATVTERDIVAGNGVVHVIDHVLLSPGLEADADAEPAAVSATYADGAIVLAGVVQTEVERSVLVDAATAAVGAVDDQLTVDPDTGLDADTAADLATLIEVMGARLVSGVAAFDGVDLGVTGVFATNGERDAVVAAAQDVGATVELERRPDATDDDAAELEAEVNEFAVANPILFEPASAVLTGSANDVIDAIARRLQEFDGVDVTVEGHTDSDGDPAVNLALSQQRADAVRDALVERGIAPATITAQGFGSERPVLVDGVEDKDASRRVEFRVAVSS